MVKIKAVVAKSSSLPVYFGSRVSSNCSSFSIVSFSAPKRENVINPKSPEGVRMASKGVNNIGTNIGLGENDLNKLVDHVSVNVRKVRDLCEQLVQKYDNILKRNCSASATSAVDGGASNSAQKSELDKRSEIDNMICTNIRIKRDKDQACVASQQESIDQVNQLERTALGIEVAKFAAAQTAASSNVGAQQIDQLLGAQ